MNVISKIFLIVLVISCVSVAAETVSERSKLIEDRLHLALVAVSHKHGLNITWQMVAKRLGISQGYMSKILNGNKNLKAALAIQVAWVLETDPIWLWAMDDREAPWQKAEEVPRAESVCQIDLTNVSTAVLLNELARRRLDDSN